MRRFLCLLALAGTLASLASAQPADAPALPLDALQPGQRGEVWTVFRGTQPEPFSVVVTGVLRNALGPGKSLIVCELTDERVQKMGAVAGMSGSPLYIDGKFAGALSYQIQRFETVRHAGFTPAADLDEVRAKAAAAPKLASSAGSAPDSSVIPPSESTRLDPFGLRPLQPVFTLGGLSPAVAELFAPRFAALGLHAFALGGSTQSGSASAPAEVPSAPAKPPSTIPAGLCRSDPPNCPPHHLPG